MEEKEEEGAMEEEEEEEGLGFRAPAALGSTHHNETYRLPIMSRGHPETFPDPGPAPSPTSASSCARSSLSDGLSFSRELPPVRRSRYSTCT
jgi:hypothetical protein